MADLGREGVVAGAMYIRNLLKVPFEYVGSLWPHIIASPPTPLMDSLDPPVVSIPVSPIQYVDRVKVHARCPGYTYQLSGMSV